MNCKLLRVTVAMVCYIMFYSTQTLGTIDVIGGCYKKFIRCMRSKGNESGIWLRTCDGRCKSLDYNHGLCVLGSNCPFRAYQCGCYN